MEQNRPSSIHDAYTAHGPRAYYTKHGADYRNPHEPIIQDIIKRIVKDWPVDLGNVLDLAAGSGELTLALQQNAGNQLGTISAIDPYTQRAYTSRTHQPCETFTFEQIASNVLSGRKYSLIVCSFALHLLDESRLPIFCYAIKEITRQLLILTPHKRPVIEEKWGWKMSHELLRDRVRARLYGST